MPSNWLGQQITFAAEIDPDMHHAKYIWTRAGRGDTVAKIAAKRGHPELAADVLRLNKGRDVLVHPHRSPHHSPPPTPRLRSVMQTLRGNAPIRLPGTMAKGEVLSVNAGDSPPTVTAGYAKYDVVDVAGRKGVNRFLGYDPIALDIAVQFENFAQGLGETIEANIRTLERFAGRGDYPGAAVGPPAVIRVSVTDKHGNVIPLIPADYQWSAQHQNAPLFRITAIAWDTSPLRNHNGFRVRQAATVTITEFTPLVFVERSVSRRSMTIPSKTSKK
jgi:hypothetical protein